MIIRVMTENKENQKNSVLTKEKYWDPFHLAHLPKALK